MVFVISRRYTTSVVTFRPDADYLTISSLLSAEKHWHQHKYNTNNLMSSKCFSLDDISNHNRVPVSNDYFPLSAVEKVKAQDGSFSSSLLHYVQSG